MIGAICYKENCELSSMRIGKSDDPPIQNWETRIARRLKLRDLHILFTVVYWGSMAKGAIRDIEFLANPTAGDRCPGVIDGRVRARRHRSPIPAISERLRLRGGGSAR